MQPALIPFRAAAWVWCRVALLSFGGPAGQIAVMHRILVDEKKWISESHFLHALNYCMLLPGPEAQQLTIYIGWLLHRTWGGIVAGTLFVLPGFLSILLLSILYAVYHELTVVQGLFYGLKPAIIAVVIVAAIRIARRALRHSIMVATAIVAFVGIFFFDIPFPWIVAAAGIFGFVGGTIWPDKFVSRLHTSNHQANSDTENQGGETNSTIDHSVELNSIKNEEVESAAIGSPSVTSSPSLFTTIRTAMIWLVIWLGPIVVIAGIFGPDSVFTLEALFFSKAAVVTFGGAYSVLAYIAQECVETYHWLQPGEMLDGMGMAESTPGPLIQVVQFVGFMGAYRNPGELPPMVAAILGSVVTTWVTFAPCFLWIFTGAPYMESLRGNVRMNAILSTITAAVVGVIFNLAIWFSLNTIFAQVHEFRGYGIRGLVPVWETIDFVAAAIAIGALLAMVRFNFGLIKTLFGSVIIGFLYFTLFMR